MLLGGYRGAGGTGRQNSQQKAVEHKSFKSGFERRERERELQFNTAGGREFQVRGAAVLNDRLANDVRQSLSVTFYSAPKS